jgi:hypothetical protein
MVSCHKLHRGTLGGLPARLELIFSSEMPCEIAVAPTHPQRQRMRTQGGRGGNAAGDDDERGGDGGAGRGGRAETASALFCLK